MFKSEQCSALLARSRACDRLQASAGSVSSSGFQREIITPTEILRWGPPPKRRGTSAHRLYVTGDTHIPADIQKLTSKRFPVQKEMTKSDYLIICGDFGGVWDGSNEEKHWIKWLKNKGFTTLFVDGNHENFEMLCSLPIVEFGNSYVHKVDEGIFHLMRGEIYTIDNKKIFTFGGAASHDKENRKEGRNWWREEMPSCDEYKRAEESLLKNDFSVDYIITHSAPESIQSKIAPAYEKNELTDFLESIKDKTIYNKWFFGHYHKDIICDEKHIGIFNEIIEL
ncbi:MAG: metallophosphoesterase [Clostridia bacterium]|nr:metallophosphoesterase [Clostridia bacterium]